MKNIIVILGVILFLSGSSCKNTCDKKASEKDTLSLSKSEHLTMSVLWYQKSAEMRAIYYQTYNWAKIILDKRINEISSETKPARMLRSGGKAIIVDIDETLLDNSPYEAELIETGNEYNKETWHEWINLAKAEALPGAVDFLNYAKTKNVEVFYISNRRMDELNATMKNLDSLNFPFIDEKHFLLRTDDKSKESRRKNIAENYEILMLIGDNLSDFSDVFENRQDDYGFCVVDSLKQMFGERFFILPNPMYGDWEDAIYGVANLTSEEKNKKRKECLKGY